MANPIPICPWSRLASLRSPPNPESHPKPQPAELSLKTTNTSSHDNNESATKSLPTTPDVPNPKHSLKLKLTAPVTFPSSNLKAQPQLETKITVEGQVTIEKPNRDGTGSLMKESGGAQTQGIGQNEKEVTTKEIETKGKGIHTKLAGSGGHGITVITISGENKGAYMQITKSQKKPFHKMGNSSGEEVNGNRKDKSGKVRTLCSPPIRAVYANSNVQCVNNSVMFQTSLTHHDPGVHLIIPKKQFGEGFHLKESIGGQRN